MYTTMYLCTDVTNYEGSFNYGLLNMALAEYEYLQVWYKVTVGRFKASRQPYRPVSDISTLAAGHSDILASAAGPTLEIAGISQSQFCEMAWLKKQLGGFLEHFKSIWEYFRAPAGCGGAGQELYRAIWPHPTWPHLVYRCLGHVTYRIWRRVCD